MSRTIVTRADVAASPAFKGLAEAAPDPAAGTPPKEDKYTDKLIKLIPGEIISVYLAVYAFVKSSSYADADKQLLQWIVFAAILLLTPVYLYKMAGVSKWTQVLFNTIAFVVWVFSFGGPAEGMTIYHFSLQFLVALFLPVYTLFIPLFYKSSSITTGS